MHQLIVLTSEHQSKTWLGIGPMYTGGEKVEKTRGTRIIIAYLTPRQHAQQA